MLLNYLKLNKSFRAILLITLTITICHCQIGVKDKNPAKDYTLFQTDSFENKVASKIFVNKFDPSKHIIENYTEDGHIIGRCFMQNKLKNGPFQVFYLNGQIMTDELFKNGHKDGIQKEYYKNGQLKREEIYSLDSLLEFTDFDSTGKQIKR